MAVARLKPGHVGRAFVLAVVKVTVSVAVAWVIGRRLQLSPVGFWVLVLQISTPVAATSYLLAAKYGADFVALPGPVSSTRLTLPTTHP